MSREGALTVMIAVAVALLAVLLWAWLRRTRRDAGLHAPFGELPADAETVRTFTALYVATTSHDQPLERLAIKGLAFRSRADVTVTTNGVALDLTGQPRITLRPDRITAVGQSTVTIDRVVETDGLVRIAWHLTDDTIVDSYLRPQDASARALADAISTHLTTTGSDA